MWLHMDFEKVIHDSLLGQCDMQELLKTCEIETFYYEQKISNIMIIAPVHSCITYFHFKFSNITINEIKVI